MTVGLTLASDQERDGLDRGPGGSGGLSVSDSRNLLGKYELCDRISMNM
jgi:hypothetical protein